MSEVWKPVPSWEDRYEISTLGNVRSIEHKTTYTNKYGTKSDGTVPPQPIKVYTGRDGYQYIYLLKRKSRTRHELSDLIAETFLGPRPCCYRVLHIDENPSNNNLPNIQYGPASTGTCRPSNVTLGEEEFIVSAYKSGNSLVESAATCQRTSPVMSRILQKHGVEKRPELSYYVNHTYFDKIDTPDKAYWLGFLTADGYVISDEVCLRLSSKDRDHVEKFAQSLGSTHPLRDSTNNFDRACCTIKIHSTRLAQAVSQHIETANKTWSVTPWNGPSSLMPHYWRGVIDGDGWISTVSNGSTKYFYTVGMCGNSAIVKGFRDFIHEQSGYNNKLVEKRLKSKNLFYQVAYTGTRRAKHVCEILKYDDANSLTLSRKLESALRILAGPNYI